MIKLTLHEYEHGPGTIFISINHVVWFREIYNDLGETNIRITNAGGTNIRTIDKEIFVKEFPEEVARLIELETHRMGIIRG